MNIYKNSLRNVKEDRRSQIDEFVTQRHDSTMRLPLKYLSLIGLLRDVSNEEFLTIKNFLDDEASKRYIEIRMVLSDIQTSSLRHYGDELSEEVYRLVMNKYLKDIIRERRLIDTSRLNDLRLGNLSRVIDAIISMNEKVWITLEITTDIDMYENCIYRTSLDIGINDDELNILIDDIERHDQQLFYAPMLIYPTNPIFIQAVENLETRGVDLPNLLLYTLRVPLGKYVVFLYSSHYGTYPVLVDSEIISI